MSDEQNNFLVFINPIAGGQKRGSVQAFAEKFLAERGARYRITETLVNGDYTWLAEKIATEKISHVVICGGDGTVNQITRFLLFSEVKVCIIPVGSGNGLATAAGISKKPKLAWSLLFDGRPELIDTFTINGQHACEICGLGLDAQVAHDYDAAGTRGLHTYFKKTVKNFFGAKPYAFEVETKTLQFSIDAFFISVANANQFGNNFTIAPKASLTDGLLDVVAINKNSRWRAAKAVLKHIRSGVPMQEFQSHADIIYFQTPEVKIKNPGGAPVHVDGEVADMADAFEFKIVPHSLWLVRPRVSD